MAKLNIEDIVRYAMVIEKTRAWWKSVRGTKVGEMVQVPEVVVDIGRERWRIGPHVATREK